MALLTSQVEFEEVADEIRARWAKAKTKEEALAIIAGEGKKIGYKNVVAALEKRVPRRFESEDVDEWARRQRKEEENEESTPRSRRRPSADRASKKPTVRARRG